MQEISKKNIRVRFAPSPTGWLHLGSARTALINYLFAKNQNGTFVLRVEDTDLERGNLVFLQQQINDLKWLGLHWDEGPDSNTQEDQGPYKPYRQSQRIPLYQKCVDQLIQMNKAYYCFLTEQDIEDRKKKALENKTPFRINSPYRNQNLQQAQERIKKGDLAVVRFKIPEVKKNYILEDIVRGTVTFPSDMVGDFVLLRSSGLPVYNFSCAVDDYFMKISHVFRSEEHLANTLRQMMIFEAFGWSLPTYGHLSLILGEDHKKLSKRHGAVSCNEYKKQGYLPDALLNFLALMGWNPKTEEEVFSLPELINCFSLKGLNPAPGVFDTKKLNWINSQHLKKVSTEKLWGMLTPYFKKQGLIFPASSVWRENAALALKSSFSSIEEAAKLFSVLSENHFEVDEKTKDILKWPSTMAVLNEWKLFLESYPHQEVKQKEFIETCAEIQKKLDIKGKLLFMPIRAAVLGCPQGLELKLIISLINKDVLLKRVYTLEKELQKVEENDSK